MSETPRFTPAQLRKIGRGYRDDQFSLMADICEAFADVLEAQQQTQKYRDGLKNAIWKPAGEPERTL